MWSTKGTYCNLLLTEYVWWTHQKNDRWSHFVTAWGYNWYLYQGKTASKIAWFNLKTIQVKGNKNASTMQTSYKNNANSILTQSVIFHCASWQTRLFIMCFRLAVKIQSLSRTTETIIPLGSHGRYAGVLYLASSL